MLFFLLNISATCSLSVWEKYKIWVNLVKWICWDWNIIQIQWCQCCNYIDTLVPSIFFNATHQVEAISIGISQAQPARHQLGDCFTPVHLHIFFPLKSDCGNWKELIPYTQFYMVPYHCISFLIGITFTHLIFNLY